MGTVSIVELELPMYLSTLTIPIMPLVLLQAFIEKMELTDQRKPQEVLKLYLNVGSEWEDER